MPAMEQIDPAEFRRALAQFCTGIVVVTAISGTRPVGLTCQSFASLSLDPPLVLFAVGRSSTTWPLVRTAGVFAVNVLGADQEPISRRFAEPCDRFAGLDWLPGRHGAPLIAGALAQIEGSVQAVYPGGDHEIAVGRVLTVDATASGGEPLLRFQGAYRRLPPAAVRSSPDRVGGGTG